MGLDAIIQARTSSSRLPSKVLIEIGGKTILEHVVNRLKMSKSIDRIIIATSTDRSDDSIEQLAQNLKVLCFRGDLVDVLGRYYYCATHYKSANIVRITADCPLIDWSIIDMAYKNFRDKGYDLYGLGGSFPDGLDFTIFKYNILEKAFLGAKLNSEREHVCVYMEKTVSNQAAFKPFLNSDNIRLTVDEIEDLELLKMMFNLDNKIFEKSVLEIVHVYNQISQTDITNRFILRNEGYLNSLKND